MKVPKGMQLVPKEPSMAMQEAAIKAAYNDNGSWGVYVGRIYNAYLRAARKDAKEAKKILKVLT